MRTPVLIVMLCASPALAQWNQHGGGWDIPPEQKHRAEIAATRPIEEILAIPPMERIGAEEERVHEYEAEQKRQANDQAKLDPINRPRYSAALCVLEKQRKLTVHELQRGRKAAAGAIDVADYDALDGLRGQVLELDGKVAEYRDRLHKMKLRALPCASKDVREVIESGATF